MSRHGWILAAAAILALTATLLTWLAMQPSGQLEPETPVRPARIERDCAPWDGAAFSILIPVDATSSILVSIWQAPELPFPSTYSFPDESMRTGQALLLSELGTPAQLDGAIRLGRVQVGNPVDGEFTLRTAAGYSLQVRFHATWGEQVVYCG